MPKSEPVTEPEIIKPPPLPIPIEPQQTKPYQEPGPVLPVPVEPLREPFQPMEPVPLPEVVTVEPRKILSYFPHKVLNNRLLTTLYYWLINTYLPQPFLNPLPNLF